MFGGSKNRRRNQGLWGYAILSYERFAAFVAFSNLCLVLFDLSYVPLRDFWLQGRVQPLQPFAILINTATNSEIANWTLEIWPLGINTGTSIVTRLYDPVKGIEPNPETQQYLERVDRLRDELEGRETDPEALEEELSRLEVILSQLRSQSREIIDTDPFALAGKSGQLAKINNLIVEYLQDHEPSPSSAKEAFDIFWSVDYLSDGTQEKLTFFQEELRPLFEVNYFRPIGESGGFVDYFPALDTWFALFFLGEFIVRTRWISWRKKRVSWVDAALWRWYDVFLFLPFFRFMRAIPVVIRLKDSEFPFLEHIQEQIIQGLLGSFAGELTEVVVVQVLNQIQGSIRKGNLNRMLPKPGKQSTYVDLNDINELQEIANLLVEAIVYKVFPKVQPDLEELLKYNVQQALKQLPGSQNLQGFPFTSGFYTQFSEQMAIQLTQGLYNGITAALNDPKGAELTRQLTENFGEALMDELRERRSLEELQDLLVDFLEEVKVNYVRQTALQDVESLLEQTRELRQRAQP